MVASLSRCAAGVRPLVGIAKGPPCDQGHYHDSVGEEHRQHLPDRAAGFYIVCRELLEVAAREEFFFGGWRGCCFRHGFGGPSFGAIDLAGL